MVCVLCVQGFLLLYMCYTVMFHSLGVACVVWVLCYVCYCFVCHIRNSLRRPCRQSIKKERDHQQPYQLPKRNADSDGRRQSLAQMQVTIPSRPNHPCPSRRRPTKRCPDRRCPDWRCPNCRCPHHRPHQRYDHRAQQLSERAPCAKLP